MNKTEEKLLGLLKIAWQNEWRLKSQLAERDEELERQRRIMQSEINMYKDLGEIYKRMFQISNGECADERNSDLSH
ncbi:hypothetical protein [Staphylococcus saprophyticus]|uniref:hypothetical protein n=1 Tax=Staphylococcus saprophyticus TaxID=29385 RepID=UPI00381651D4